MPTINYINNIAYHVLPGWITTVKSVYNSNEHIQYTMKISTFFRQMYKNI